MHNESIDRKTVSGHTSASDHISASGNPLAHPHTIPATHLRTVSDAFAWAERLWGDESPAARGLLAFDEGQRQGTMLVTRGRRPGNIRIDAQFRDRNATYTQLSAEVREGWMRDIAKPNPGRHPSRYSYSASYSHLLDTLLEVSRLPNQRTVRVEHLRKSA
jgi:hypothetical protein